MTRLSKMKTLNVPQFRLIWGLCGFFACLPIGFVAAEEIRFDEQIAPILLKRCVECHNDTEAAGGLNLTSRENLLKGSDSGDTLSAGHAIESYLLDRVKEGEMPPEKQGKPQKLPIEEIKLLEEWIDSGAEWPEERYLDLFEKTSDSRAGRDWWSLQPIRKPVIPTPQNNKEVNNPIDAFILHQLEKRQMEAAPLAPDRTLVRRLYIDLIGLPPTAEQTEKYLTDDSPQKYEKLVDELLSSPHFGERWARHWLDLVRFAETCGYERDQVKTGIWKYRDYVINAINDDKPYNEFIREQLAGDELPERSEQTVIATGFLRAGTWNDEPNDPQEYKYERLEDMVHATSSAFLGITLKCARCHDHKFDPFPQKDYYRMASSFWAGFIEPRESKLTGGPSHEELGFEVYGWTDRGRQIPELHLLHKGDPKHPGPIVEPAHLSFLPELDRPFTAAPENSSTSHRRLQLAEWITDNQNPLPARVIVNRLWQHHFGKALVRSPNNFGFTGEKPTHPELLDWLASELIEGGWKLKRLHKLMVMSRVYRQSVIHPQQDHYNETDFANQNWWHAERRRLQVETLRDAFLQASGTLDLNQVGGKSFKPSIPPEGLEGLSKKGKAWTSSPPQEQNRRSLYIYSQRTLIVPFMTTFDFCDTTLPCAERDVTTVAPQALALLNNEFVHDQSRKFAKRILQNAGEERQQQIKLAWRYALGRNPTSEEIALAETHLGSQLQHFQQQNSPEESVPSLPAPSELPELPELALHLRADKGVEQDQNGKVQVWHDLSANQHRAIQTKADSRPDLESSSFNGHPALRFNGSEQFMTFTEQLLTSQCCSLFAVASDEGSGNHREIFSNWNGAEGNSVSSLFLGTTGSGTVRFSDNFHSSDAIQSPETHFLLSAINSEYDASLYLNGTLFNSKGSPLTERNLDTPYVIGQQGNFNHEFWKGNLAELIVFNRDLSEEERDQVHTYLIHRYQLGTPEPEKFSPEFLALTSLCHVLLNSNELIYVD